MSVATKQAVLWSERRVVQAATTNGDQKVQQNGYKHHYFFAAWFVQEDELQSYINDAIPAPYAPEGDPTIAEIEKTKLFNITWMGVHYTNEPLGGENRFSLHSGEFY